MNTISLFRAAAAIATVVAASTFSTAASAANPLSLLFGSNDTSGQAYAYAPTERAMPGMDDSTPARLRRQVVDYRTNEAPGTIIIDTPNTYLYLVLGNGRALRYGIGVGRDGFTW